MSVVNRNGVGNVIITYKLKTDNLVEQVAEEEMLLRDLSEFLRSREYKFLIADDDLIDERIKADKELLKK